MKHALISFSTLLVLAACGVLRAPQTSQPEPIIGMPVRLQVPRMGIHAPVEHVALTPEGEMDVPADPWNVAWYSPGPRPGEQGNAVIDGHLDSETGPAVFWEMRNIQPEDQVIVLDDRGQELEFRVTRVEKVKNDSRDKLQEIFGSSTGSHLNLITCIGRWNKDAKQYSDRLVVFTDFVGIFPQQTHDNALPLQ